MNTFDFARQKIAQGGAVRNGPPSEHGVLALSLSLLAIAESIDNLAEAVRESRSND